MNVRYSPSVVTTLAEALTPPDAHAWALTDVDSGRIKGVYASESLATAAVADLVGKPGLFVLTIVHPNRCNCADLAA